jgi:hypothetical protein
MKVIVFHARLIAAPLLAKAKSTRRSKSKCKGQNINRCFNLGQFVATPGALALEKSGQSPREFLWRHVTDDWGKIPEEDEGKLNQLWKKVFAF